MIEEITVDHAVKVETGYCDMTDGIRLEIRDFIPEGWTEKSPVLVFVAGWVSLISGWKEVLSTITKHCRVIYVETREKQSAVIPEGICHEFTMNRMVEDLTEIIQLKVTDGTSYYLAGSSLGSSIILEYLKREPGHPPVKSILISPITHIDFPLWAKWIVHHVPASAYHVIKHLIIFYLTRFRVDKEKEPEQAEKYRGTLTAAEPFRLKANAQALSGYSIWNRLELIQSHVVVVGAKTDKLHGLAELEKMVATLPSGRLEIMESNKETHSGKAGELILKEITNSDLVPYRTTGPFETTEPCPGN